MFLRANAEETKVGKGFHRFRGSLSVLRNPVSDPENPEPFRVVLEGVPRET
jgi:hypothetical protein